VTASFDPIQGPIYVEAEISGPTGRSSLRLLLDTGATTSMIDPVMLIAVGSDPGSSTDHVQVTMGGGTATVPRVVLNRLTVLGQWPDPFSPSRPDTFFGLVLESRSGHFRGIVKDHAGTADRRCPTH
jgi:hypothetical protein